MTTVLLIRHASHDLLNHTLAGRMPGVHLSAAGAAEAGALAARLAALPLTAVYSSPLERAHETATVLAARRGLPVHVVDALNECDFGEWTGQSFETLHAAPAWAHFNTFRSGTRPPGGELLLAVQARVVAWLTAQQAAQPDAVLACVSHGDVIKATLLYYLGAPLDLGLRLHIAPASVSILALHPWGVRLLRINDTGDLRLDPE